MTAARLVIERSEVVSGDATLVGDVYRLDDDVARPCLLQRVPYGRTIPAIANGALDVRRAVEAGFVVVVQDCRGRGDSTGRFAPFCDERRDAAASFDWIVAQPWSDGAIGMFGRSYAGLNQWLAATSGHAALRAIAPTISGGDPVEWLRPDGVFEWGFALWWAVRYLSPGFAAGAVGDDAKAAAAFAELASLAADSSALLRIDADSLAALSRDALPFLADWLDGTMPGEDDRCLGPVDVPAFVTAGWFDILARSTLDTFQRSATHPASRLVIGPWAHGGTFAGVYPDWDAGVHASDVAIDLTGQVLRWFQSVLGGGPSPRGPAVQAFAGDDAPTGHAVPAFADAHPPTAPAVQAFVCGADRWQPVPEWPPATSPRVLVAVTGPDGALRLRSGTHRSDGTAHTRPTGPTPVCARPTEATAQRTPKDSAALDLRVALALDVDDPFPTRGGPTFLPGMEVAAAAGPRAQGPLLDREDVVVIAADPFETAMTIIGDVRVDMSIEVGAVSVADGLVCVRMCDRSPAGVVVVIGEGAAVVPRAAGTHPLTVRVGPCGWQFQPGHALVVAVSRASWPRFEPPRADGPADVWLRSLTIHLPEPTASRQ